MRFSRTIGLAAAWVALSGTFAGKAATAQEKPGASPAVPGFERLQKDPARKRGLDDEDDDAPKPDPKAIQLESGWLLLGELGCTSCHAPSAAVKGVLSVKQAPILDAVG